MPLSSQDARRADRKAHLSGRTDNELREVAEMVCVVPLDEELASIARELLTERSSDGN